MSSITITGCRSSPWWMTRMSAEGLRIAPAKTSGVLDRIIVAVELARAAGVEGDRLHRLVLGFAEPRQHLQHLILPHVDGHRERHARRAEMRAVARLADAVRGRGQHIVGDPLHVIA